MKLLENDKLFFALVVVILIGPPIIGAWLGMRQAASREQIVEETAIAAQATAMPTAPTAQPLAPAQAELVAPPEVVAAFNKGGCGNCHVIPGVPGANGQVGPDLSSLGVEASNRRSGYGAEEYVRESILEPNAFIVPECPAGDCPAGVMLQAFAQTLGPDDLDRIVSYLSVLGTDQAVVLSAQPAAPVALDASLPPESALEPFIPLPKEPASDAQIALGKHLFFDSRLSGNNSLSCSSCHQPDKTFTDGAALSRGYPSTRYFRNVPTLLNTAHADRLYWDGRMDGADMPTLVRDHLTEAHFMSMDGRLMVERLNQAPAYVELFNEAFGGEPSFGKVLNAIAAYVGSLNSPTTAYDRYVDGDSAALSEEAEAGLALFEGKAGCDRCHSGALFSDYQFYNIGVATEPAMFNDPERHLTFRRFFRVLGVPNYRNLREDVGLYALTSDPDDWGKFRTPSLREVGRTAPYMHNGSLVTLEDVLRFYDQGGGSDQTAGLQPLGLTEAEVAQLAVFLGSLTSDPVPVEMPHLPDYHLVEMDMAASGLPVTSTEGASAEQVAAQPGEELAASTDLTAVFNQGGCGACHHIPGVPGAVGQVGPDLSTLGAEAASRRPGYSGEDYIRESILDPNAFVVPDCPLGDCLPNVMPASYDQTLSPDDLEKMVSYLSAVGTGR